jgi:NAD(P)-dependent dehydrogenase (short-subunit alcohol dehydrogenase family)
MLRIVEDEIRAKNIVDNVIPLQRLGLAADVANGCLWLLSDDASYITGANLPIDGGLSVI